MKLAKLCVQILLIELVDVGVAVDLDVMFGLDYADAIKHTQEALLLDGHGELFIKHVE